jgi:hypothetical protein
MSDLNRKPGALSRRSVAIGGGIAAALGIAALGVTVPRLLGKHYRQTPYDDILSQLKDRDAAARLGQAAIGSIKTFGAARIDPAGLAKDLRHRLERRTLADVTDSDLAQSHLIEVHGWVLPETVVLVSVLAATQS